RIFTRARGLLFEREEPRRLDNGRARWCVARRRELALQVREVLDVFAVDALRHILERAHCLVARLLLREASERQLEQRDVRREPLHHARAEKAARLVETHHRMQMSVHKNAAQREQTFFVERVLETEKPPELIGFIARVS